MCSDAELCSYDVQLCFFFQAEDGIRDLVRSRGLGDVYKRQDYDWLRDHPAPTIELPMGDGPVASSWPNYWSLGHWNQVVNGYSGNITPTYLLLRDRMNEFPSADTIWLLQGIGVENVVVHSDDPTLRPRVDAALPTTPEPTLALDGPEATLRLPPHPRLSRPADPRPSGPTDG